MSIINDALKKVQTNLAAKDAAVPLLEQKSPEVTPPPKTEPSPAVAPPLKTLATIEQEQKEKESQLKRLQESMTQKRSSPLTKFLKISFLIVFLICSTFTFLYVSGYFKEIPFAKKFPQISTLAKSSKQRIISMLHKPSSPKSTAPNPALSFWPNSPETFSPNSAANISPAQKMSSENLVLKGIITKNNHQVALINDGIYEEGSTIEGIKVKSISLKEVKLLDGDRTITLTIGGGGSHAELVDQIQSDLR